MTARIVHIITRLERGGAGMMLLKLLTACDRSRFAPAVITLMDLGTLGERIEDLGIPIRQVGMQRGRFTPPALFRLRLVLRDLAPDLIQGWMYHGNAAALVGRFAARTPIVWNIRHSVYDLSMEKPFTRFLIRFGSRTSGIPERIIYNTRIGAEQHEAIGYRRDSRVLIPNGFDTNVFRPDEDAPIRLRRRLNLPPEARAIGMIARNHPIKDHAGFIRAAAVLNRRFPDVHFVLIGAGVDPENEILNQEIRTAHLVDRVHLLGERADVHELTAGLDLATLSSWGEGFPNVIGEAMSCGVPCVVTDVGDTADLVGETGIVVPPKDPEALAGGWARILQMEPAARANLGREARRRIEENFSLEQIAARYDHLYREVLA